MNLVNEEDIVQAHEIYDKLGLILNEPTRYNVLSCETLKQTSRNIVPDEQIDEQSVQKISISLIYEVKK